MEFDGFLTFVAVGVGFGWLAGVLVRNGRYGLVPDVMLGLAGSGAATAASWFSGVASVGVPAAAVVAAIGAAAAITCQRQFWPAPRH